ncbi:hypothetical protein Tco_0754143 [Tanacetum coccineum]
MSTSATSIRKRRVIPTHCQCNMPLVRRIAGTSCNSFYWIDPELTNPWYKTQMFEIYLTLNPEERHLYHNQITAQNQLENLQNEFEVYQHDMQMQIENMELEVNKSKKKAQLLIKWCVCNEFAVGSFGVGSFAVGSFGVGSFGVSVMKDLLLCL